MEDKISGKVSWKERKIFSILNQLGKGDLLLIIEFPRLGRSVLEIMEIILFAIDKEIKMYTVKGVHQKVSGKLLSRQYFNILNILISYFRILNLGYELDCPTPRYRFIVCLINTIYKTTSAIIFPKQHLKHTYILE